MKKEEKYLTEPTTTKLKNNNTETKHNPTNKQNHFTKAARAPAARYLAQQPLLPPELVRLLLQGSAILLGLDLHGDEGALDVAFLDALEAEGGVVGDAEIVQKVILPRVLFTLVSALGANRLLVQRRKQFNPVLLRRYIGYIAETAPRGAICREVNLLID